MAKRINVKQLNGTSIFVDVGEGATVADLKVGVFAQLNIEPAQQRLIFAGRELSDENQYLDDINLQNNNIVHLVIRVQQASQPQADYNNQAAFNNQPPVYSQQAPYQDAYQPYPAAGGYGGPYGGGRPYGGGGGGGPYQPLNDMNPGDVEYETLVSMIRYSRLIQIFAFIDGVFLLIFGLLGNFLLLIFVPLAYAGYYGAKNVSACPCYMYALYELGMIALRIFLVTVKPTPFMIILAAISVLIELFIFSIVVRFAMTIPSLSDENKAFIAGMNSWGVW